MKPVDPLNYDESPAIVTDAEGGDLSAEEALWFLPGPVEPEDLRPVPKPASHETAVLDEWLRAEAGSAAHLARVAGRLGALDDRLARGPQGWRHRLALIEAAELGWWAGERIGADRLALWTSLRLQGVQDDSAALARVGWAVRRLGGGPGPEPDLAAFLDRRDPESLGVQAEPFADRAGAWLDRMAQAANLHPAALHPITRACMGFHLWSLAGLGPQGDRIEAAVTAARIAAGAGKGAVFVPLVMGGAGRGLRGGGPPPERLARWLGGMEAACLTAMRQLDDIEAWSGRAAGMMTPLSGKTPPALRAVFTEWPLVSAPMAEAFTGASRAAVQRNLAWMQAQGLIREMTGQGRYRMWRATN